MKILLLILSSIVLISYFSPSQRHNGHDNPKIGSPNLDEIFIAD